MTLLYFMTMSGMPPTIDGIAVERVAVLGGVRNVCAELDRRRRRVRGAAHREREGRAGGEHHEESSAIQKRGSVHLYSTRPDRRLQPHVDRACWTPVGGIGPHGHLATPIAASRAQSLRYALPDQAAARGASCAARLPLLTSTTTSTHDGDRAGQQADGDDTGIARGASGSAGRRGTAGRSRRSARPGRRCLRPRTSTGVDRRALRPSPYRGEAIPDRNAFSEARGAVDRENPRRPPGR